jgi:hypothetical protein
MKHLFSKTLSDLAFYATQSVPGDFNSTVVKILLVRGNLYRKSGEQGSGK